MITNERILELAWYGALEVWVKEKKHLEENPSNEIAAFKERKAWDELEEIRALNMVEGEEK